MLTGELLIRYTRLARLANTNTSMPNHTIVAASKSNLFVDNIKSKYKGGVIIPADVKLGIIGFIRQRLGLIEGP